jgi:class 3 adenylate cyclase/tetratricopeptide (TPR) repeat protein
MRVSAARLEGERKLITVLFADVVSSTELLAGRDPEEARAELDPVLEVMIEAVHRFDGTVNQVLGDGIMALFGAPLAHEDHAVRACCAAARMQAAMSQRVASGAVRIRVGLNSGEVVVRSIGSDLKLDYSAVGETTHLAARMEHLAEPGTILLAEATARLAAGFVELSALGPQPVKGLRDPVTVHRLVSVRPIRSALEIAAARGLSPFRSRGIEMALLERALENASAGRGAIVGLVGNAGIGKSRLLWEFVAVGRGAGCLVLEGGAGLQVRGVPFAPLVPILEAWFNLSPGLPARAIRDRVGSALDDESRSRLLAAALALLGQPVDDPAWLALDPEGRRGRIVEVFRRLLLAPVRPQPLVVVVEDLHWIDPETEWVLETLVQGLPTARLLLLTSYRPEYRPPWVAHEANLELRLEPLSSETADLLLRDLVGPSSDLVSLLAVVAERAAGNPFFLEEGVRHLADSGRLLGKRGAYQRASGEDPIDVPQTIHAVLAARIDRLAPVDKHVLQVASVLGHDVPQTLLRAVADLSAAALDDSLGALEARGLLLSTTTRPVADYSFRHALTQEVALAGLLRERRRHLDVRIVETIEALAADEQPMHVDRLAHHAMSGQLWDRAVVYCRQAGVRASERSALRAAAAYFGQALDALAKLPETGARQREAIDLRLQLRHALSPLGESRRLMETLMEAERLADGLNDRRRSGLVSAFLANFFTVRRIDFNLAIEYGRRALTAGEEIGDEEVLVLTRGFLALAHYGKADYREAVALADENARLLQGERQFRFFGMALLPAVYCRTVMAWSLAELGEFARGLALADEALAVADQSDHVYSRVFARHGLGVLALRKGDHAESIAALERGAALAREHQLTGILVELAGPLASAYVLAGRAAEAEALLEDAIARAVALRHRLGHGHRTAGLAEAYLGAGRPDEALPLARMAVEFMRAIGGPGLEAWAWHLVAEAAVACGDLDQADEALAAAADFAERLGMRPLVARCRLARSRLHARQGATDLARVAFQEALDDFHRLRMPRWEAEAEAGLDDLPN